MSNVCADPCSMAPDDRGVMRLRIAGDPDTAEWPYACTIQNSDLQRDPTTGCLWADPLMRNTITAVQGDFFPGLSLAGGANNTILGVANLTITNPDPCRAATALATVWMGWTLDADFDPATTYGGFTLSRQITGDSVPVEGAFVETYRNHIGSRTTAEVRARTTVYIPTIAAGGTATINLDMRASNFQGSMIWTRAQGRITALVTSV